MEQKQGFNRVGCVFEGSKRSKKWLLMSLFQIHMAHVCQCAMIWKKTEITKNTDTNSRFRAVNNVLTVVVLVEDLRDFPYQVH